MKDFLSTIGFNGRAQDDFLKLFIEKNLVTDDILFDYHDIAENFYFIKNGSLAVYKLTGFLKKMQVVALLDSGTVVGEAALLDGHIRNTQVVAIEGSTVACLSKQDYKRFCVEYPEEGFCFLEYLFFITSLRLEKTSARLAKIL